MKSKSQQQKSQRSLASFFQSSPATATKSIKRSRCPTEEESENNESEHPHHTAYNTSSYKRQQILIRNTDTGSHFQECPLCNKSFPLHKIERHASYCNGNSTCVAKTNVVNIQDSSKGTRYLCSMSKNDGTNESIINNAGMQLINEVTCNKISTKDEEERSEQQNSASISINTLAKHNTAIAGKEEDDVIFSEPVPGLYVIENFISEDEELRIINELDGKSHVKEFFPWRDSNFNGTHQYKRWGVHCDLRSRRVSEAENQLPNFMNTILVPKLVHLLRTLRRKQNIKPYSRIVSNNGSWIPNEANAINYQRHKRDELLPHVDDRKLSKEIIANLSLAGTCYMTFINVNPLPQHQQQALNCNVDKVKVLLNPRCLQLLTGPSRYNYSHSIEHHDLLSDRRISLTMRQSPLTLPKNELLLSQFISNKIASKHSTNGNQIDKSAVFPLHPQTSNHVKQPNSQNDSSLQEQKNQILKATVKEWWKKDPVSLVGCNNKHFLQPVPGLYIFEDFISKDEEDIILKQIDDASHPPDWKIERHSGLHKEKRYGIDHDMWSPTLRQAKYPLPTFMESILIPKLRTNTIPTLRDFIPNDINIIEYCQQHGHWLSQHVDDRSKHKEPIANISLAGDCYMTFKNQNATKNNLSNDIQKVLLKQRTLFLLTGKVRYDFSHGIDKNDLLSVRRVSVTMRQTTCIPS